jgi:hypothetical protein
MEKSQKHLQYTVVIGLILAAAALRLLPHPNNFTPIAAMALFGARFLNNKTLAFVLPLGAMILSDYFLGFHSTMPFVYGAFILVLGIGFFLRKFKNFSSVVPAALGSSALFFLITNAGVWMTGTMYSKNFAGLMASYAAGIPFFHWTIAGDLFYSVALFGVYALAERSLFQPVQV